MTWQSRCSTCGRVADRIITGRRPGRSLYSALSCLRCAPRHRLQAIRAGPLVEDALDPATAPPDDPQPPLF